MNETRKKAPKGKYRVIGVDMFSAEDYLVGDYTTKLKALRFRDEKRKSVLGKGELADRFYVYDDKGEYIGE